MIYPQAALSAPAAPAAAQLYVVEFATVNLVIQWVGILVIGGLLLFLTPSIRRRFLDDWTYQRLIAGRAAASGLAGCVAVADVNRLKEINDREGHGSGDAAIRRVATAIRSVIRGDDLLFRWGGDEFLVILESIDEEEAGRRFARVNELLAEPALSVSFGIAPFGPAAALEAAIERADALMYERKCAAAGR